jgi:hypothetical protein
MVNLLECHFVTCHTVIILIKLFLTPFDCSIKTYFILKFLYFLIFCQKNYMFKNVKGKAIILIRFLKYTPSFHLLIFIPLDTFILPCLIRRVNFALYLLMHHIPYFFNQRNVYSTELGHLQQPGQ